MEQKNTRALGALAVIITSICYGLVPSFSFLAFRMGVETETLLFNKFLYAAVIMWAYLLIRKINFRFSRRAVLGMVVTCAGYIGLSTTLYISFDYISGSLAPIVSFTFPAMIVAIEMITRREPVSIVKIAAVLLSFGGLVLIVWSPDMKSAPVGIFFAFLAAVGYVVYLFGLDSKSVRQEDSFAIAGYEAELMGYSPKFSSEKLAKKLNLNLPDIDMFEINEAFASQAFAVARDLNLDMDKVNIYGGGISIGHPLGATGAILTVKVLYELMRTDKKDAMISMCIGGGQGMSMYFTKC